MRSAARAFVPLALAALTMLAAAPAAASVGSVPADVREYVTQGGLAASLDDVYGTAADGSGIPFDETTTPGPISRIFTWTDARLAGELEGDPTRMLNEWAVPVSLGEEPVGVAIVWINPEGDAPELAEFTADAAAAAALAAVPDDARLVHDRAAEAWFAVVAEVATPLVTGRSGVTAPTEVARLALVAPEAVPEAAAADPNAGLGFAIATVVVLLAIIVVALALLPRVRAARHPTEAPASLHGAGEVSPPSEFAPPEV
ncbi:hypothetical protein [Protaetiibacter larvae]|uniref:DUF2167 domain-containing protein n=1 Tax=Protaetiibacter larvae TaxID=2592654 RepID=A0A5C1Y616_9MICO|nr:hypothetical protein [Protaetiibacter larvae]QEO08749.1 hypothetical protein FLP23_01165 [Protaetiibacter larvae]